MCNCGGSRARERLSNERRREARAAAREQAAAAGPRPEPLTREQRIARLRGNRDV